MVKKSCHVVMLTRLQSVKVGLPKYQLNTALAWRCFVWNARLFVMPRQRLGRSSTAVT